MLNRPWYSRQANKPWKEGGSIKILVRADTLDKTLGTEEYFTQAIVDGAVERILDFYGRGGALTTGQINQEDVHRPSRPATKPNLLISVQDSVVAAAPWKVAAAPQGIAFSRAYATKNFLPRAEELVKTFTDYQKKYKFFGGSVSPGISFVQEHNRLVTAVSKIKDYVEFNKLPYRTDEDDEVIVNFDAQYRIVGISLLHKASERALTRGSIYYLQDSRGLKNPKTNELLFNLANIYNERKNPPPWSEFVDHYMSTITVDYFGRPRTPKCSNTLIEHQDKNNPVVMTLEDLAFEAEYLNSPANKECLVDEAATEKVHNNESIKKIAADIQKFSEKADMVQTFIDKWGINHLIDAALECLAIASGIPRGDMPRNIGGASAFLPRQPPKKISFPRLDINLPAVSIGGDMTNEIKKALMEALRSAIVGTLQALGDILVDLCQGPDDDIGQGLPLNGLIDDFPNPIENNQEGGVQGGLLQCYDDYGIVPAVGNYFLELVSNNIRPSDLCDLINDAPNAEIIRQIFNLIEFDPALDTLQGPDRLEGVFEDEDALVAFFMCIGNLMSPDYCADLAPISVTELDPCTVESLLAAAVDDELFNDLIDAYNEPASLMPDDFNLACGGGIVPPLAQMPVFRHSLTSLYNTVFEIPKTTFANDITTLKSIYMKPTPGCSADTLALREAMALAGSIGGGPSEEAAAEGQPDPAQTAFLNSIFPTALMNNPQVQMVTDLIKNATNIAGAPGCEGVAITYDIAKDYQNDLAIIDTKIESPYESSNNYEDMYFYFMGTPTAYFSIGSGPPPASAQLQMGPHPTGAPTITANYTGFEARREELAGLFFDNTLGRVRPGTRDCGTTPEPLCAARYALGWTYDSDPSSATYDYWTWPPDPTSSGAGRDGNSAPADQIDALSALGALFGLFDAPPMIDPSTYPLAGSSVAIPGDAGLLKEVAKTDLYFNAYMSLLNSIAYNIRNSKLFTVEGFAKLALVPIPCPEGGTYGKDLFDINTIINEALKEFADNSCSDRTCSVGPVEDSLIFATVNAYIQILLLEQLLKNIFIIDAYGAAGILDNPLITARIIEGIYESIPQVGGAAATLNVTFIRDALEEAAVIYVDKQRIRLGPGSSGEENLLPDPVADPVEERIIEIPQATLDDPAEYRKYAFEYLVKKRMFNTIPVFKDIFSATEPNFNTSFVLNGLSAVKPNSYPWTRALGPIAMNKSNIGDLVYYRLIDSNNDYVPWNYGLNLEDPSQTLSQDEVDYAETRGLFTRERFVSLDFNYNNFQQLRTSEEPVDNLLYDALKPLFFNTLIPSGDTLGPEFFSPEGSDNILVSEDTFDEFLRAARNINTSEIGGLLSRKTIFKRDTELFGDIDVTYYFRVPLDRALEQEYRTDPRVPCLQGEDCPPQGTLMAVKGPVRRSNYDALRFWATRIQGYFSDTEPVYIGPYEAGRTQTVDLRSPRRRRTYQGGTVVSGHESLENIFGFPSMGRPAIAGGVGITIEHVPLAGHGDYTITPGPKMITAKEQSEFLDPWQTSFTEQRTLPFDDLKSRIRFEYPKYYPWDSRQGIVKDENGFFTYRLKRTDLYYTRHNVAMYFGVPFQDVLDMASGSYGLEEDGFVRWWTNRASDDEKDRGNQMRDYFRNTYKFGILGQQSSNNLRTGGPLDEGAVTTESSRYYHHPLLDPGPDFEDTGGSAGKDSVNYGGQDFYDQHTGISLSGPGADSFFQDTYDVSLSQYLNNILEEQEPAESDDDATGSTLPGLGQVQVELIPPDIMQLMIEDMLHDLPPQGQTESVVNTALNSIVSNIHIGTRIMYSTPKIWPDEGGIDDNTDLFDGLEQLFEGVSEQAQLNEFISTKSNYIMKEPAGYIVNVDTGIRATHKITDHMRVLSPTSVTAQSLFKDRELDLIIAMTEQPQYRLLFNEAFDTQKLVAFMFLYGMRKTEDLSADFNHIFDDTKAALRIILRAALAGDDYAYIDPEAPFPADQAAAAALGGAFAGPFAQLGSSFILKMLIETPLRILKALAEIVDPHVIIGKTIKTVSGQAFQIAEPIWDAAQMGANVGAGVAQTQGGQELTDEVGLAALEMKLPEFIQAGIDEAFAAGAAGGLPEVPRVLIPEVSSKGIDLIGKLPFLFMPPPGPLGVAYILLNLSAQEFESLYLPEPGEEPPCYPPEPAPALPVYEPPSTVDDAPPEDIDTSSSDCE